MTRLPAMIAVCLLVAPLSAFAQGIAGTVRDTSGAVLPGVTVEASSPALIEKTRSVVTDGGGQYNIVDLKPGTYTVVFSLPGFSTIQRAGIELTTGFTASINADLKVGSVEETITVTGASPVVDTQNSRSQVVLTRAVIDEIPTGRQIQNYAVLIPGVVGTGSTNPVAQDVGGQSGQNHLTMAIHGGKALDQHIMVDGLDMTTWTRAANSNFWFADSNFQEFAIDTAGSSAEAESGGIRLNLIPRDGANRFSGTINGNISGPKLQSNNYDSNLQTRGLRQVNRIKEQFTLGTGIGGPLRQDKLWFYGGYSQARNYQYIANLYWEKDYASLKYEPDLSRQVVQDQDMWDQSIRTTWQASPRNKITGYYNRNRNHVPLVMPTGTYLATGPGEFYNHLVQATWNSPLSSKVLLESGYSRASQTTYYTLRPEIVAPRVTDSAIGLSYRANSGLEVFPDTTNLRGSMSYVTGAHAFKVGTTVLFGRLGRKETAFGNKNFTVFNGSPSSVTYQGTPVSYDNVIRPEVGLYAQDQWRLSRLTFNLGVRMDYFRSGFDDQRAAPTEFVPFERVLPKTVAVTWKDLSPRFGANWDLFGTGKTAIKATVNRYVLKQGTTWASDLNNLSSASATSGNNNSTTRSWTDNGDLIVQGDPLNPALNGELGPSTNLNFGVLNKVVGYDPDFAFGFGTRPAQWEFSASIQHELVPRMSVNAGFFQRAYGNFTVFDNTLLSSADQTTYCVPVPVDPRLPASGQNLCGMVDRVQSKVGQSFNYLTAASNFGKQVEQWRGMDLTVNSRLAALLLQGGVSFGRTVTDNCDIVTALPETRFTTIAATTSVPTSFCRVETPNLVQVKLLGSYSIRWGVSVSGTYQTLPGPEIQAIRSYASAEIAPSLGRALSGATRQNISILQPGTLYGERLHQVDLRLSKGFRMGSQRVKAMVDVFNVTNGNSVTVQNNTYGTAWQTPQAVVPARLVKFSGQLDF